MIKLNLGCGLHKRAGYVNVDREQESAPDVRHDLETFPWPFDDNAAGEIVLNHVLEHLGATADVFIRIMQELYRVAAPQALVHIAVPHPRHDNFIGDPTHVRVVTPQVLSLFSRANCLRWQETGAANSPLALYHDVDFEIAEKSITLEPRYLEALESGAMTALQVDTAMAERNNVASEIRMTLLVVK